MSRRDPHRVDPSRATQHDNVSQYRRGQLASRRDKAGPAKLRAVDTGGIPPRRGCRLPALLLVLAAPVACMAAGLAYGWWAR